jgi:L,D-transpeptidase catalytic domain
MPHMQRLTWSGIALHAGYLPGYPASAGCLRMPVDFAAKLYSVTGIGATVIIADHKSAPHHTVRPGLLFSGKTGTPPAGGFVWTPDKSSQGPVSIILSAPDRKVYIYRNGVEIGRAPVAGLETARIPARMFARPMRIPTPADGVTGSPPSASAENSQI